MSDEDWAILWAATRSANGVLRRCGCHHTYLDVDFKTNEVVISMDQQYSDSVRKVKGGEEFVAAQLKFAATVGSFIFQDYGIGEKFLPPANPEDPVEKVVSWDQVSV